MPYATSIMKTQEIGVLPTTVWEIARKAAIGRLPNFWGPGSSLSQRVREAGFRLRELTWEDAESASALPDHHRDPMDRLLIATALRADMTVITSDAIFAAYNVKTIW